MRLLGATILCDMSRVQVVGSVWTAVSKLHTITLSLDITWGTNEKQVISMGIYRAITPGAFYDLYNVYTYYMYILCMHNGTFMCTRSGSHAPVRTYNVPIYITNMIDHTYYNYKAVSLACHWHDDMLVSKKRDQECDRL